MSNSDAMVNRQSGNDGVNGLYQYDVVSVDKAADDEREIIFGRTIAVKKHMLKELGGLRYVNNNKGAVSLLNYAIDVFCEKSCEKSQGEKCCSYFMSEETYSCLMSIFCNSSRETTGLQRVEQSHQCIEEDLDMFIESRTGSMLHGNSALNGFKEMECYMRDRNVDIRREVPLVKIPRDFSGDVRTLPFEPSSTPMKAAISQNHWGIVNDLRNSGVKIIGNEEYASVLIEDYIKSAVIYGNKTGDYESVYAMIIDFPSVMKRNPNIFYSFSFDFEDGDLFSAVINHRVFKSPNIKFEGMQILINRRLRDVDIEDVSNRGRMIFSEAMKRLLLLQVEKGTGIASVEMIPFLLGLKYSDGCRVFNPSSEFGIGKYEYSFNHGYIVRKRVPPLCYAAEKNNTFAFMELIKDETIKEGAKTYQGKLRHGIIENPYSWAMRNRNMVMIASLKQINAYRCQRDIKQERREAISDQSQQLKSEKIRRLEPSLRELRGESRFDEPPPPYDEQPPPYE